MDYPEFVRGCHLGVFPSYYEPWGYTPGKYDLHLLYEKNALLIIDFSGISKILEMKNYFLFASILSYLYDMYSWRNISINEFLEKVHQQYYFVQPLVNYHYDLIN